ncbi:DgyrCDS5539 [Dimorphilus gyrociliatus]|uniref:Probable proline--tRNA ligase, mitochondrial n=1 Tax=Dimorphilus gyrociliatus TaxID=2664684 RepID=A0A7I8VMH5_9ANNE|nr:DgyrCDS5539 [Dimorphilus gyrociliatus]
MFPILGREGPDVEKTMSNSAKLLVKLNWVKAGATGTFTLMPPLQRSVDKLCRIIENEMNAVGGLKVTMPSLATAGIWKKSGRYNDMGSELLKLKDRNEANLCLSPTHEETVTSLVQSLSPISYKNLPIKLYQIGPKFRDEMRPKNALLRCREFLMKDLYSFDDNLENSLKTYKDLNKAYENIFNRLNLDFFKVQADTGTMGGSSSHEYHIESPIGEDTLILCKNCGEAFNKELTVDDEYIKNCRKCGENVKIIKSIEIGHTFLLGTKYSETFKANLITKESKKSLIVMGCYGIGVTRLVSACIEVLSSKNQLRLPELITPHQICIIPQREGYKSDITLKQSEDIAINLSQLDNLKDYEVVLDDRLSLSIGQRIKEASNFGYTFGIVVGKSALEENPKYEVIDFKNNEKKLMINEEITNLAKHIKTV